MPPNMTRESVTLPLLLCFICCLLVIYLRLSAYLQHLRRRAAKLSKAGGGLSDSGVEWTLASSLDNNLRIYTAIDASRFSLRFAVDSLPTGAAELMCLPREMDLVPTWNKFCAWGGVLRVASPTELWAGAVLELPWPVPRHAILVHAELHDRMGEEKLVDTPLLQPQHPTTPLRRCTRAGPTLAPAQPRVRPLQRVGCPVATRGLHSRPRGRHTAAPPSRRRVASLSWQQRPPRSTPHSPRRCAPARTHCRSPRRSGG